MKPSSLDLNLIAKKTRKREFLPQMENAVLWARLVELIAPYYLEGKNGRHLRPGDHAAHLLHAAVVRSV